MKNNKKGFTLAELLVVVGIIAVLIAIAIPVFSGQVEKAREAVDAANIRSKYAELMSDQLTGDTTGKTYVVELSQEKAGWTQTFEWPENLIGAEGTANTSPYAKGTATLAYSATAVSGKDPGVTVTYAAKN